MSVIEPRAPTQLVPSLLPEKGETFKGEFWMSHGADGIWTVGIGYGEDRAAGSCGETAQEALSRFAQVFINGIGRQKAADPLQPLADVVCGLYDSLQASRIEVPRA